LVNRLFEPATHEFVGGVPQNRATPFSTRQIRRAWMTGGQKHRDKRTTGGADFL
jgi:hypothetical protein